MEVRFAREEDLPQMMILQEQVLAVHLALRPDLFVPGGLQYSLPQLRELLHLEDCPVFVAAEADGTLLGQLFAHIHDRRGAGNLVPIRTLEIDNICVRQGMRGQQVGSRLFAAARDYARREDCYNIILNVWAGNDAAWNFYHKLGMTVQQSTMELIVKEED